MARDKARHKRYEFLFDKLADADEIAHVLGVVRPGYSLADYVRDLVRMDMGQVGREVGQAAPVVHVDANMQPLADVLRELMQRPAQPAVGELVSDGLDMTSRRRPARPQPADSKKAGPGTAH